RGSVARRNGRSGRSWPDPGGGGVSLIFRQRSQRARARLRRRSGAEADAENRLSGGAAASLLDRPLSGDGVRARQARGRARARRGGLLALRRRRIGGSGAPRFSASGAISTRAALTIWRRASPFSLPSLAARRTPRRPRRSAPSVALR